MAQRRAGAANRGGFAEADGARKANGHGRAAPNPRRRTAGSNPPCATGLRHSSARARAKVSGRAAGVIGGPRPGGRGLNTIH
eukprot:6953884-Pyramimonas_sp.AAC.1